MNRASKFEQYQDIFPRMDVYNGLWSLLLLFTLFRFCQSRDRQTQSIRVHGKPLAFTTQGLKPQNFLVEIQ